jgi:OHCU decarboxylase
MTELARMDRATFLGTFDEVFEHSPWVAEGAWEAGPFAGVDDLHGAMVRVVGKAGEERQLALVRAHPDLAGKAALRGELTAASTSEQAGSGLDQLSPEELARFNELNDAYRRKFGFPFVMAVKGKTKHDILAAFTDRLGNAPPAELERALAEIAKIARFRLEAIIGAA